MLNESMLIAQGVEKEAREQLLVWYDVLYKVLENPEDYDNPVLLIEDIEYQLQELWNLTPDKRRHRYWNMLKGCSCPKRDNMERWGTDYRVFNGNCRWHGVVSGE